MALQANQDPQYPQPQVLVLRVRRQERPKSIYLTGSLSARSRARNKHNLSDNLISEPSGEVNLLGAPHLPVAYV